MIIPKRLRPFNDTRLLTLCAIVVSLNSLFVDVGLAGSGQVIETPRRGIRNRSGLKLKLDTQWVDASGYRSIRIHVSPVTGGAKSDRTIRVDLWPNSWARNDGYKLVRQWVELKQGSTSATAHVLLPQQTVLRSLRVEVYEGGSELREHASQTSLSSTIGNEEFSEAIPSVLLIDSDAPATIDRKSLIDRYSRNPSAITATYNLPDATALCSLTNQNGYYDSRGERARDLAILQQIGNLPRCEMLAPTDLPPHWNGLTCFDLVVISLADLNTVQSEQPERFQTITRWAAAGGNLLVFGVGEDYSSLAELQSLLEMHPIDKTQDSSKWPGWQPATNTDFNDRATNQFRNLNPYNYYEDAAGPATEPSPKPEVYVEGRRSPFLIRPYRLGLVLAMADDQPFPGITRQWSWVFNTIEPERSMWYRRHGLSQRRNNHEYWNFMVPGTGQAPVLGFGVLFTLFALIIGPVNYFVLQRKRRLYLLLLTIPVCAGLVIFGLFAYAVLTDGIGTRVRVRSYTLLDQTSGSSVSWSRQSYYAGLAPSQGLSFPADAAVYMVEQFPESEYRPSYRRRELAWEDGQNFRRGYMQSRVMTQALVVSSQTSASGLSISRPTNGGTPKVMNRLGAKVQHLVVRDDAGDYWQAKDLPDGKQMPMTKVDEADWALANVKKLIVRNRPVPPKGVEASEFSNLGRNWYGWSIDDNLPAPSFNVNLMERRISQLQKGKRTTLDFGTYVAVTQTSPEVPLGIDSAREIESLHLIEGKY